MEPRIWINPRQPQTLYIAQILMYLQGSVNLLFWMFDGFSTRQLFGSRELAAGYLLLVIIGKLFAAYGIANERTWGYLLGVSAAFAPLVLRFLFAVEYDLEELVANPISLMFQIALVVLLLHEQSRSYKRIWFK